MMQTVEEVYAPFGKEVINEINRQIALYGNLLPLLRRLNVPSLGNRINEHKALREFIYKYGTFLFLKAAQSNITSDEIERMKVQKLMGYSGGKAPVNVNAVQVQKPLNSLSATASDTPAPPPPAPGTLRTVDNINLSVRSQQSSTNKQTELKSAQSQRVASERNTIRAKGGDFGVVKTGMHRKVTGAKVPLPIGVAQEKVRTPARQRIMTSSYYGPDRRVASDRRVVNASRDGSSGQNRRKVSGRRSGDKTATKSNETKTHERRTGQDVIHFQNRRVNQSTGLDEV